MSQITYESIKNCKMSNDTVYYWLTEWKDKMLLFIKKIKPIFYYKIPNNLYPSNIIAQIKPMIPYWYKYNNINLYIIKITFNKNNNINIKYKNIYNKWIKCVRSINETGPCCLPLYIT